MAAVELENPAGDVVQKIAIVRHGDDRALVAREVLLQPLHAFGVEVVGRFVQQEDGRLLQEQPRQRDAAALAA